MSSLQNVMTGVGYVVDRGIHMEGSGYVIEEEVQMMGGHGLSCSKALYQSCMADDGNSAGLRDALHVSVWVMM